MALKSFFPWQTAQWRQLLQLHQQQRMPHALLFSGLAGVGKKQFAFALANSLLCSAPGLDALACGVCSSCGLLNAKSHSDLLVIEPEETSAIIKIDQIRELVHKVGETALQGGYRVVIIDPADALNINASNALLKTLEEPIPNILFILISHQGARLPATIRSRCQEITFEKPDHAVAVAWLSAQSQIEIKNPDLLLSLANGAPLKALEYAEESFLNLRKDLYDSLVALSQNKNNPLAIAAELQESNLLTLFALLQNWLRDLLRFKLTAGQCGLINIDYQAQYLQLAEKLAVNDLLAYIDIVQPIHIKLLNSLNLNKQLLLEEIFIRWVQYVSR